MARRINGEGTIRKRSDNRWEGRYFDPVLQKQKSVYGKTQKEVSSKIKDILRDIDEGAYIAKHILTMGQWLDFWFKTYNSNVKPLTYDAYSAIIKNHIKPQIGDIQLQEVQPHHIQGMYNYLIDKENGKGLSVKTVQNVHCVTNKSLQQAVKLGYIKNNPASACVLPKHIKKKITPMDTEVIGNFLKEIKKDEFSDLYYVTLFTGMRQGEVLGLKWDCIDFKKGCIRIKQQIKKRKGKNQKYYLAPTKSSKERIIYPAQFIMDVLQETKIRQNRWKQRAKTEWSTDEMCDGLVFTTDRGEHLVPNTVYKHYKKIVSAIEQDDLRFHDLRHSFAVISLENGDNIKLVQEALGHFSAAFTLDTYGHITNKALVESANRMQSYISSLNQCSDSKIPLGSN